MAKTDYSRQTLSLKQGDSLKNLGQKAIWPDWVPKSTQKAYKLRRVKLAELESKLKSLLSSKTLTTAIRAKINTLTREIKTVVETDPTIANYRLDKKGKVTSDLKNFYNTSKPIEAHHIKGLDKFYEPMRQLDDFDLFDLHAESAEKGHYFGNHPKNRLPLDRSLHSGRTRQAIPRFESIHGRIDFQDLSPDEYGDYIHKIIANEPTDTLGSSGGPQGYNRKRLSVPEASEWEYGVTNETKDKFFEMADADQALANEFKNKKTNPVLFEGKVKTPFIKEFINKNPDPSQWPKGAMEAVKNQDAEALIKINEGIELKKVQDFDQKLRTHFDAKIGGKVRTADAAARIGADLATGNYIGAGATAGTLGAMQLLKNKPMQKAIGGQIARLVGRQGAKTAAKAIPGLDVWLSYKDMQRYLQKGQLDQAGIAALSGAIGWIPVIGDGGAAVLDFANTGLDISRMQVPTTKKKKVIKAKPGFTPTRRLKVNF